MGVYLNAIVESAVPEISAENTKVEIQEAVVDPIQFIIDSHREDLTLFESIIETDYAELYNEAGIISLSESDISFMNESVLETIKNKASEFFKNLKILIGKLVDKVIIWIEKTFESNKKIAEAAKAIDVNKMTDCPVRMEYVDIAKYSAAKKSIEDAIAKIDQFGSDYFSVQISGAVADLKKLDEEIKLEEIFVNSGNEPIIKILKGTDIENMIADIQKDYKDDIAKIKELKKKSDEFCAKGEKFIAEKMKELEKAAPEAGVTYQTVYDNIKELGTLLSKFAKIYTSMIPKAIAKQRIVLVALIRWNNKTFGKAKENKDQNPVQKPIERVEGEVVTDTEESAMMEAYIGDLFTTLLDITANEAAVIF